MYFILILSFLFNLYIFCSHSIAIFPSRDTTFFIDTSKNVYACGKNDYGQLGLGNYINTNKPTLVENLKNIVSIVPNEDNTFFIDYLGNVYACGANYRGEIGLGEEKFFCTPKQLPELSKIMTVISKLATTFFIDENHEVYICGANIKKISKTSSDKILYPIKLDLNIKVIALDHHCNYILFIDENHDVYAYGDNQFGQLGLGEKVDINELTLVPNLKNIIKISTYNASSLFLDEEGNIYGCGYNEFGQVGFGTQRCMIKDVFKLSLSNIKDFKFSTSSIFLDYDGYVYVCGFNDKGQLKLIGRRVFAPTKIQELSSIKEIFLSCESTFYLSDSNEVHAYGANWHGEFGSRSNKSSHNSAIIKNIYFLVKSMNSSFFIDEQNKIFACGNNFHGQLGITSQNRCHCEPSPVDIEVLINKHCNVKKALP